jgi:hypothetical protein
VDRYHKILPEAAREAPVSAVDLEIISPDGPREIAPTAALAPIVMEAEIAYQLLRGFCRDILGVV